MAITWDTSWTNSRRKTVEAAMERIERMLVASATAVRAVSTTGAADTRAAYVAHFGDPSLAELTHVRGVVAAMESRVADPGQTLVMSFVPDAKALNALGLHLPTGINFDDVEAFVVQRGVPKSAPLSVYVGPAFFEGDVYVSDDPNERTGTGTILHELSHGVGGTHDFAYTHEAAYAGLTAHQRARNADSYRAYCQSFDVLPA
jgi:hypothetical protein